MKNSTFFLIIAVVVIAILAFVLFKECNRPKPEIGYIKDSVQYWRNQEGQVASLKQRIQDFAVTKKGYLDSIATLHRTKPKYIKEIVTVRTHSRDTIFGQGETKIIYKDNDSTQIQSLSEVFSNDYYNVQATISVAGNDSHVEVETFDTLNIVTKEVVEGGLFNRQRFLQVDITHANPHAKIEGIKAYRQPLPKPKKFGVGIIGGYGVSTDNFLKPKAFVGVGLSYNLIRF